MNLLAGLEICSSAGRPLSTAPCYQLASMWSKASHGMLARGTTTTVVEKRVVKGASSVQLLGRLGSPGQELPYQTSNLMTDDLTIGYNTFAAFLLPVCSTRNPRSRSHVDACRAGGSFAGGSSGAASGVPALARAAPVNALHAIPPSWLPAQLLDAPFAHLVACDAHCASPASGDEGALEDNAVWSAPLPCTGEGQQATVDCAIRACQMAEKTC